MTLYLDTSSLVKLYLQEDDSDAVEALVRSATVVATSLVAYAEARAVFARCRRERLLSPTASAAATRQLDADWPSFLSIEVTDGLVQAAGALADTLGLRGFDAIHLASFQTLLERTDDDLEFSSADVRLAKAARKLG